MLICECKLIIVKVAITLALLLSLSQCDHRCCFLYVIYQIVLIVNQSIILNDVHIYPDVIHLIYILAVLLATHLSHIHQKLSKYPQFVNYCIFSATINLLLSNILLQQNIFPLT